MGRRVYPYGVGKKMTIDETELNKQVEIMSLLPDRYYIILKPLDGENFTLTAYDTTSKTYENEEDFNPAMIIQEGVMETIREKLDDVYDRGAASIKFKQTAESMIEEVEEEFKHQFDDNVIKVDFGNKQ
jgi:predicted component of type VI protein secretion system